MSLGPDSLPRRRAGAEGQRFGEEFVVLDPEGRMLRGLNETGAQAWALSNGQRTAREIASELARTWGVEEERALADCLSFLNLLEERGLIQETKP
jgi:pyrroloquinoline quinone biosynthesis protein D